MACVCRSAAYGRPGYRTGVACKARQHERERTVAYVSSYVFSSPVRPRACPRLDPPCCPSRRAAVQVLEYDFQSDLWYCHPPLPRPVFGGAHGFLEARGTAVVVSGSSRFRVAAHDDALLIHMDRLISFEACMVSGVVVG